MASRPLCTVPGCDEHYACRLRGKGLQVSPRVSADTQTRNWKPSVSVPPGHWRNIAVDVRPDGSQMPILSQDGSVIRHNERIAREREIESHVRHAHNATKTGV